LLRRYYWRVPSKQAEFEAGRTDLVFELIASGKPPNEKQMQTCAYFGDVSAIRFLLANGARADWLGDNFDLNGAAFHGHWRLCCLALDLGAKVNHRLPDTGETALHAAIATTDRVLHDRVVRVLLQHGADPKIATIPGAETGSFMRDCRTRGETPLHRAAAFGDEHTIEMLLRAGAKIDARDANGDTPLGWASWYLRPRPILRKLCYGPYRIHPDGRDMRADLAGDPA